MTSQDKTFVAFTPEQAAKYAADRGTSYPQELYQAILDYHSGSHDLMLDVGTGPGKVVLDFLPYFKRCIGCDASVEVCFFLYVAVHPLTRCSQMIGQARKEAAKLGDLATGRTGFEVCDGAQCAQSLSQEDVGNVDLITVAMAVHWLELDPFYSSAAKALKPGGTLAIWTLSSMFCHPSDPNCKEIQAVLSDLEDNILGPYAAPGNMLSQNGYDTLPLPWTLEKSVASSFDQASFTRKDWDRNGVPSSAEADGSPGPFLFGSAKSSVAKIEAALGSSSMVIRWREAHPDRAGTDEDVLAVTAKRLKQAMGDRDTFVGGASCSLLMMRKLAP